MPGVTRTEPIAPGRQPRTVILLGSTGSIGTQAIDVLRRHPERFRVVGLSAPVSYTHLTLPTIYSV